MLFCRSNWRRILFPDFVWQSCCNPCCKTQNDAVLGVSTNVVTTCHRYGVDSENDCGCNCCGCCCNCCNCCGCGGCC